MDWLTKEIEQQYKSKQLHPALQEVTLTLESLASNYRNKMPRGITVTDLWREHDLKSYHHKWQAIDLRIRDWDSKFRNAVAVVLMAYRHLDGRIQHEFEDKAVEGPHLHLEFDDDSLG